MSLQNLKNPHRLLEKDRTPERQDVNWKSHQTGRQDGPPAEAGRLGCECPTQADSPVPSVEEGQKQ